MPPASAPSKSTQVSRVPYLPGLDGLRAIAVLAVIVYHANSKWLGGGFLGVEVFFVISGYLITLLLVAENERNGSVSLKDFWKRRARRLLPALFVMLLLLVLWTSMFERGSLGSLRGDVVAGVFYGSNWFQVWVGAGYTAVNEFAPLRHLWSLAVEEQFYLLWPLIMIAILRKGHRRLPRVAVWFAVVATAITVLIGLAMPTGRIGATCESTPAAYWSVAGRCIGKVDLLYLSTPTRAGGLLLGAAMALLWRPYALLRGPMRNKGTTLDPFALVGVLGLGVLMWALHVTELVGEEGTYADPWLFRGGFLLTGVATLMIIAAVAHPRSRSSSLLGNRVLRTIGERSYGLYLYHWPIFQALRHEAGVKLKPHEFALAMLVTVVLTEISYRYIELPIREKRFKAAVLGLIARKRRESTHKVRWRLAVSAFLVLPVFAGVSLATAENKVNEVQASLDAADDAVVDILDDVKVTPPPVTVTTLPAETVPPTTVRSSKHYPVFALGDSVMKGAARELKALGAAVDAEQDRQGKAGADIFQQLKELGVTMDAAVVHLGTNGPIKKETMDRLLRALVNVPKVAVVTSHANRGWTEENNAMIRALPTEYPNVIVVDWDREVENCVGACLTKDGIHLDTDGRIFYAQMIFRALGLA